ncbi:MAG: hypothetical protein AB1505_21815 [Candidatus Latescibacterota bacterium]
MKETLTVAEGGRLVETRWIYDESRERGEYGTRDVTEFAIRYLFAPCELAEAVVLRDILLLLNTNLDLFDDVFHSNWTRELVTEGLSEPDQPYDLSDDEAIQYLELYWHVEFDGQELHGFARPGFHGDSRAGRAQWRSLDDVMRELRDRPEDGG